MASINHDEGTAFYFWELVEVWATATVERVTTKGKAAIGHSTGTARERKEATSPSSPTTTAFGSIDPSQSSVSTAAARFLLIAVTLVEPVKTTEGRDGYGARYNHFVKGYRNRNGRVCDSYCDCSNEQRTLAGLVPLYIHHMLEETIHNSTHKIPITS